MAGKHGVTATIQLLTVVKLGVISVLQNVQKDGFQVTDLLAPLESPTFQGEFVKAKDSFKQVLPEVLELDGSDLFQLGSFGYKAYKDIRTEFKPALVTLAKERQAKLASKVVPA